MVLTIAIEKISLEYLYCTELYYYGIVTHIYRLIYHLDYKKYCLFKPKNKVP